MKVKAASVAPEESTTAEFDWQQKYGSTNTPRVTLLASSVVFELKKATIKWKRRFISIAKRKFFGVGRKRTLVRRNTSNKDNSLVLDLFTHLSSVFPSYEIESSCDAESDHSQSHFHNTKRLLDLDDASLLRIAQFMDGKTVMVFAQVCSRLRRLIGNNISSLERIVSATYEVFIDFNKHKKQDDVRALKCGRSIQDLSYHGQSLDEIIPAILLCQLRITFGNNVELPKWAIEVYRLYKNCRLIPVALIFGGSSCLEGVDLRCFLEKEFIAFVRLFSPHLREVQLATSRLFAFSAFPHLLLSMINLLSFFGMTYEEPSVRYSTDDITTVVHLWRFSPMAHSCEIFINRSYGYDEVNWLLYEAKTTTDGNRLTGVTVQHALLDGVILNFHLH